ncbi:hypothetical protein K469DRAFT_183530 [Zopfia rhizophila CBS 207.26]|uniref:Uncharacterized protein n=1 Tax=Zopfia rhizophila CBS 207.26 TaxID=1314779 RepID=A0A6A6E2P7_9PEZI|nr:hypothetical protein K469DRAFT_183530 [Zopfia rhizophila CBS 207.26]
MNLGSSSLISSTFKFDCRYLLVLGFVSSSSLTASFLMLLTMLQVSRALPTRHLSHGMESSDLRCTGSWFSRLLRLVSAETALISRSIIRA